MKIKTIEFKNLGPFYGKYSLDLNTIKNQPIILIGGNNGSGKSTLLKLIKIGLHGHFALGLKVQSNLYFNEINNLINNSIKNGDEAGISIFLEFDEDYTKKEYLLKRYWKKTDQKIVEDFKVYLGNKLLNVIEVEDFSNRLRYKMPLSLLEASFFDGEEIKNLIKNEPKLSDFLKTNFNILFDLELFSILENDLHKYIKNELLANKNTTENQKIILEMDKIDTINHEIKYLKFEKDELLFKKGEIEKSIITLEKELNRLGKLDKISKIKLLSRLSSYEKLKEKYYKELKEFLENEYAFYLNKTLLNQVNNKIIDEKSLKYAKYIEEIINSKIISESEAVLSEIKNNLCDDTSQTLIFSNYNIEDKIMNKLANDQVLLQKNNYKHYKKLQKEIMIIKEKLEKDEIASSYVNKVDMLQEFKEELNNVEKQLINCENKLEYLNEERYKLQKNYEQLLLEYKSNKRNSNSIDMADKIIDLLKKYSSLQIEKIIRKIELESTRIFNKVIHKNNFIRSIIIDQDNFKIRIKKNDKLENLSFLSSGEQQILISSIIWAFYKLTNKKIHFIIDTPLARLDTRNKLSYTKDLISSMSNQVIILSTDSEVDKIIYDNIKDKIYKSYVFENNGLNTTIRHHYFNFGGNV